MKEKKLKNYLNEEQSFKEISNFHLEMLKFKLFLNLLVLRENLLYMKTHIFLRF